MGEKGNADFNAAKNIKKQSVRNRVTQYALKTT